MKKELLVAMLLCDLVMLQPAWGFVGHSTEKIDDPDIKACFAKALPMRTIEQNVIFNTYELERSTGSSSAKIAWRQFADDDSRVYVRLTDPPARAGLGLLVLNNFKDVPELHLYLPELRSVRRITGNTLKGSMQGTNFSYEDFLFVYGLSSAAQVTRVADQMQNERKVFVTELTTTDPNSAYSLIRAFIDQKWCIPLRMEFFSDGDHMIKRLDVDLTQVKQIDERFVPMRAVMYDLKDDTNTEVIIQSIKIDKPIRDSLFSVDNLARGR